MIGTRGILEVSEGEGKECPLLNVYCQRSQNGRKRSYVKNFNTFIVDIKVVPGKEMQ